MALLAAKLAYDKYLDQLICKRLGHEEIPDLGDTMWPLRQAIVAMMRGDPPDNTPDFADWPAYRGLTLTSVFSSLIQSPDNYGLAMDLGTLAVKDLAASTINYRGVMFTVMGSSGLVWMPSTGRYMKIISLW